MNTLKSYILPVLFILICACTVILYKVPDTIYTWLLNTLACGVLGFSIVELALKSLNH